MTNNRSHLSKLSMMKIKSELTRAGIAADPEDIGHEAGMAQNLVLTYGGVTPMQAATGQHPRGFMASLGYRNSQ